MMHPNNPTIPNEVLSKIANHRPHLRQLIANIAKAPAQAEKTLADAYLMGSTQLTPLETWRLASCSAGRDYGDNGLPLDPDDLRARIKALGLTQQAFANLTGYAPVTIRNYLAGIRRIPRRLVIALERLEADHARD
jgi:hypothetical protein